MLSIYHRHKGEVLKLFVEWKRNMEKHTGRKIKVLHLDNGEKYTGDICYSYTVIRT